MTAVRVALAVALLLSSLPVDGEDRARPVRPVPFERVLMPFLGEGAVANQYWVSQFWARNESASALTAFFPFPCQFGSGCPPLGPFEIPAGGTFTDPTYGGNTGVFLQLPKGRLHDLTYTLRVEDASGLIIVGRVFRGTELPLVPEEQFAQANTLLNVPVEAGFRKVLRVYGLGAQEMTVQVRISASVFNKDTLLTTIELHLRAGRQESGYDAYPAFGTLDLTDVLAGLQSQVAQGRVTIQAVAEPDAQRIWSFVSLLEPGDRSFTAITPGR